MGTSGTIVELDGGDATPAGHDRGRAVALAFTLCLAVGSAFVGRDSPAALAPRGPLVHGAVPAPASSNFQVFFTAGSAHGEWIAYVGPWPPVVTTVYDRTGTRVVMVLPSQGTFFIESEADVVGFEGIAE